MQNELESSLNKLVVDDEDMSGKGQSIPQVITSVLNIRGSIQFRLLVAVGSGLMASQLIM